MTSRSKLVFLTLLAVFVASILVPAARADQWNKETIVTFSHPVEVPGKVLPAGTYVMKIANSQDRQVVQIFTQDQKNILATIAAVPDYRGQASDKTVISFEERPSGKPEALRSWFYPGDNYGVHFVYPKSTRETDGDVVAGEQPPAMVAPLTESMGPKVSELTAPPVLPVLVEQDPEPAVLAENMGPQPTQANLMTLPKTAGNYLLLPLLGFLLLGSGSAMLIGMRRATSQANNS